jgi:hypothetical protein
MLLISKIIKRNPDRKHNQTSPATMSPSKLVVIGDLRSQCEGFQPSDQRLKAPCQTSPVALPPSKLVVVGILPTDQSSDDNDAHKNYRKHCAIDSLTSNDLRDDIRNRSMEQTKKEKEQRRKERKHRKEQEKKQIRDENILTLYDLHNDIWGRNKYVRLG